MRPSWLRGAVPGYGRRFTGRGGMVTISSKVDGRLVRRRVSIVPAFDPDAISMSPIPGWTAGSMARAA